MMISFLLYKNLIHHFEIRCHLYIIENIWYWSRWKNRSEKLWQEMKIIKINYNNYRFTRQNPYLLKTIIESYHSIKILGIRCFMWLNIGRAVLSAVSYGCSGSTNSSVSGLQINNILNADYTISILP